MTVSLAGRTAVPAAQAVPVRVGGFGGAEGLACYLEAERIDALIDATHPYAARMTANATRACETTGTPLVALRRQPWIAIEGDCWIDVADVAAARAALGDAPRRVFLALGRNEVAAFAPTPQHFYLVRSVDPVDPPLGVPRAAYITGRGPFTEADDLRLLQSQAIDCIVCKNSGGSASYGKIAAARTLGLPVIMLARPPLPAADAVETVDAAVAWLDHGPASVTARGV